MGARQTLQGNTVVGPPTGPLKANTLVRWTCKTVDTAVVVVVPVAIVAVAAVDVEEVENATPLVQDLRRVASGQGQARHSAGVHRVTVVREHERIVASFDPAYAQKLADIVAPEPGGVGYGVAAAAAAVPDCRAWDT